jgi:nicotinate-nucleotide adenylyltransferase
VGLFGGSFNPAHDGHVYIAREALKRLALDEIWFLVSPQNPLKSEAGMAALDARLTGTLARCGRDSRLRVLALESELGTRFTADSLAAIRKRWPRTRFVWLMGADNLAQIHRWRGWRRIFNTLVIAVFARPAYDVKALAGRAARALSTARVAPRRARSLAAFVPPAWTFFPVRHHPASATRLRAQGKGGFVGRGAGRG